MVGKLKGANGSVRNMTLSKNHPYIATVSLDRFARYSPSYRKINDRIYNTNTNKLFRKIYLKHKLVSVAIIDDHIDPEKEQPDESELTKVIPKYAPQNEIKKRALEMKAKMKEAKLRLTFEKKKKVHREQEEQAEQLVENEYEEEDWDANEENEEY